MIYSMDLAGRVTHFTFRLGTTCSIGIARSRAYFVLRNVEGEAIYNASTVSRTLDLNSLHRRRLAMS